MDAPCRRDLLDRPRSAGERTGHRAARNRAHGHEQTAIPSCRASCTSTGSADSRPCARRGTSNVTFFATQRRGLGSLGHPGHPPAEGMWRTVIEVRRVSTCGWPCERSLSIIRLRTVLDVTGGVAERRLPENHAAL